MAPNSKKRQTWERRDEVRLREAIREISRSSNLRYFIRNLLGSTGVQDLFPSDNALSMARAAGKHEIGMTLIATMNLYQADLYPHLLLEEQNELAERASSEIAYERPDRGEPEPGPDAGAHDEY